MGSLSHPRLNIFTVGNMRVMICLGQGGLRSLSASSLFMFVVDINGTGHVKGTGPPRKKGLFNKLRSHWWCHDSCIDNCHNIINETLIHWKFSPSVVALWLYHCPTDIHCTYGAGLFKMFSCSIFGHFQRSNTDWKGAQIDVNKNLSY